MDKTFITKLVADAIKYLGNKIDKIADKKINLDLSLDLSSEALEKLQSVDHRQINTVIKEMKSIADGHSKSNQELISTLQAFEKATKDDTRLVNVLSTSQNLQKQMITALDKINTQLKAEFNKPEENEDKAILTSLNNVVSAVKGIKLETQKVDFSTVVKEIVNLQQDMKAYTSSVTEALNTVATAMSKIKFDFPKEFKLDNEQLRSIRSAGSGVISMPSDTKTATTWRTDTVALTTANTEYTYTFPANTVSWTMKLRVQGATLYYASATGKFPTSGDDSDYMTMLPMGTRSQDNVEWSGKTMYLQSDTATQVVEFDIFTL